MSDAPIVLQHGSGQPLAAVIWLHGLGADGHDFVPIVPELDLPDRFPIRFVFPHASMMPVTANGGYVMRAWYDIYSRDIGARQDEAGIRQSQAIIESLVDDLIADGISSERIVLAGFSQGGVIALQTGLRSTRRLAGVMALSTYLALEDSFDQERSAVNRDVSIFLAHGDSDPVVIPELGQRARDRLQQSNYSLEWHQYRGLQHSLNVDEIGHIRQWLIKILGIDTD